MAKFVKGTNSFYRRLTKKREKTRDKSKSKKLSELKSITFEFRNSREKEIFYGSFENVLKRKDIMKYFVSYNDRGNRVTISTTPKMPYIDGDYFSLAIEMLDEVVTKQEDGFMNIIKLNVRKGKSHLHILVGQHEKIDYNDFNKIPGKEIYYFANNMIDIDQSEFLEDEEDWTYNDD